MAAMGERGDGWRIRRAPLGLATLVLAALACGDSGPPAPYARTCSLAQPAPADWRLKAIGTHFVDGLGRTVFLRGVDAGGRSKFAPYVPFDYAPGGFDAALASYMDRAKAWGIDVMRVPFTWAAVEPVQGQDDADFLTRYDALLDAAWARGIWTVVDFHQDVYAEAFCGDGFPAWTIPAPAPAPHHDCPQWSFEYFGDKGVIAAFDALWADGSPVKDGLAAMWDRMAARYADKPGVLGFEIINEPGWGSQQADAFEAGSLSDFYAMMVPRIRARAPSSLIFLDPTGLAGVSLTTKLTLPPGDGLVFAPHFYPVSHDPDVVLGDMQPWSDLQKAWNVPVFVGEFGVSHDDDRALPFMSAHFDALDALSLSGTEWEYSVAAEAWNGETDGIVAADGTEYPVASAVVRPFPRAVAGDSVTTRFDTQTRTFSLDYAPVDDAGLTEVSLPARAYPAGFDVDLQGACVDTSHQGELLIQADAGATKVSLRVTGK